MPEENGCLILTSYDVSKLRYTAMFQNVKFLYTPQCQSIMDVRKDVTASSLL